MGMLAAAGIKASAALGAAISAGQIFVNGQLVPAHTA
jgi:hypothetical protein